MPRLHPRTISVTMPDGQVMRDVPADITQEELWDRYTASQMPTTPIESGVANFEAKTALHQALAQQEHEGRQRALSEFEQKNPEARYANPLVVDEPPAVDPYLAYKQPHLPPSPVQKLGTTIKTGLLEDQETQRRVMARELFPNDPQGMDRVGFLDGQPVYIDDAGNLQQLSSGTTRFLANMTANSPEMVGGIAGGAFGGVGGAAVGSGLAHGIKRTVAGQIYGEPFDPVSIGKGMALEGGISLAGEVPGRAFRALGNRGTFVDMTPKQLREAQDVQRRIKDTTGIDVDIAQASGNRRLIGTRAFLGRYPGKSADILQQQDERALAQFHERTNQVLDAISGAKPSEIAEAGGVNAADAALRTVRREVSNKVRPLYEAAYEENPVVTDPAVLEFLKLPFFPEAYKAGQQIAKLEYKEAPSVMAYTVKESREKHPSGAFRVTKREVQEAPISQPDLRSLDYLKQGLDAEIENLKKAGQGKLAGALEQRKKEFVAALDGLPSEKYQAARRMYAQLYDSRIGPLENGPVGVLAKLKDQDAVGAAAKVFSDANVSESQIELAKRAIQAEDPGAWNDLVRTWLAGAFNKARTETQTGVELNPAGKMRKDVYGNPVLRKKMQAILPEGAAQTFDDLMFAAQKLSSTPIAGSNTMRDEEIKEILKGRALNAFKWITSFRKKSIDTAERIALEDGTEELAIAMTDPKKIGHIRRVLRMRPSTEQAILLSTIIAARTGAEALRAAYPAEPDSPNIAH